MKNTERYFVSWSPLYRAWAIYDKSVKRPENSTGLAIVSGSDGINKTEVLKECKKLNAES